MKFLTILLAFIVFSCSSKPAKDEIKNNEPQDTVKKVLSPSDLIKKDNSNEKELTATLPDIAYMPDLYIGKKVEFKGKFLGYSGSECNFHENFSPLITRSDWIFSSDSLCIYVTGGAPSGLNPMNAKDKGKDVTMVCKVKLTGSGKIILEFLK